MLFWLLITLRMFPPLNTFQFLIFQLFKFSFYRRIYIFKKELLSQTLFREYGRFRYEKWLETEKLKNPYFSQSMSNSISLGDGYSNRHQSRLKSKKISFYTYQFFNFALGLAILEYSKNGILFWKLFWPNCQKKVL